jgi:hypothetical protein
MARDVCPLLADLCQTLVKDVTGSDVRPDPVDVSFKSGDPPDVLVHQIRSTILRRASELTSMYRWVVCKDECPARD